MDAQSANVTIDGEVSLLRTQLGEGGSTDDGTDGSTGGDGGDGGNGGNGGNGGTGGITGGGDGAEEKKGGEIKEADASDAAVVAGAGAGAGATSLKKRAEALFDYAGQAEDELSFTKGDIIVDVDEDKPGGGWFTGCKGGASGIFPGNYVAITESAAGAAGAVGAVGIVGEGGSPPQSGGTPSAKRSVRTNVGAAPTGGGGFGDRFGEAAGAAGAAGGGESKKSAKLAAFHASNSTASSSTSSTSSSSSAAESGANDYEDPMSGEGSYGGGESKAAGGAAQATQTQPAAPPPRQQPQQQQRAQPQPQQPPRQAVPTGPAKYAYGARPIWQHGAFVEAFCDAHLTGDVLPMQPPRGHLDVLQSTMELTIEALASGTFV